MESLVVGGVDYGDADRVVHLLTKDGRLSAFAHGAKTSRRRFQGALEPFTSIEATIAPSRRAEGMPTLVSAVVLAPRLNLRSDLPKIALASYAVELSERVSPEGQSADGVYERAVSVLDHLAAPEGRATLAVRRAFELALVDALGYRPELERCVSCGDEASPPHLDLVHGGLLCGEHRGIAKEIGVNTLAWMKRILREPGLDPRGGLDDVSADRVARALTRPMGEFFASLLTRPLKSAALLEEMQL